MEDLINWFVTNKTWLFSGIGVVVAVWIIKSFRNKERKKTEKITSNTITGNNNNQAGRDVNNITIQEAEKKNP